LEEPFCSSKVKIYTSGILIILKQIQMASSINLIMEMKAKKDSMEQVT
jgi:hypothetical protein